MLVKFKTQSLIFWKLKYKSILILYMGRTFFLINELAVKWWISQVAVVAFVAWVCRQWLWPSGSAMIIGGRHFGCSWSGEAKENRNK